MEDEDGDWHMISNDEAQEINNLNELENDKLISEAENSSERRTNDITNPAEIKTSNDSARTADSKEHSHNPNVNSLLFSYEFVNLLLYLHFFYSGIHKVDLALECVFQAISGQKYGKRQSEIPLISKKGYSTIRKKQKRYYIYLTL